jgi:tRNA C32,U32 (ribose-2'-O)-methylase TrmJ
LFAYKWKEYFNLSSNLHSSSSINRKIASKKEFQLFMNYLNNELDEIGFLYPKHKSESMFNNIQTMFLRSALSKTEIQTLWGMIKKLRNTLKN